VTTSTTPGVLCLSHLSWEGVWQRPQQLLSRLARTWPVLFVHDPHIGGPDEGPRVDLVRDDGAVRVVQPVMPDRADVLARWREVFGALMLDLLRHRGWARELPGGEVVATRPLVVWLSTPVPVHVLPRIPADLVVYDVMDELSAFRGAGTDHVDREPLLLRRADLVFAGGPSLYAARRDRHPRVHLFASGVDAPHFAAALDRSTPIAPVVARLPRPVLGFYGVIDERIDLDLLAEVARARSGWSIVLAGPVSGKIADRELPHAPNLHWLGAQPYAALPALLRGVDVCLMPFALTPATRFISPTKALEYMAAGRPVVSTPVPDVVSTWGHVVRVADGAEAFVAAVERALGEDEAGRRVRHAAERELVDAASWDGIASRMRDLIDEALARVTRDERRPLVAPAGRPRTAHETFTRS
jgi:glycosyltransferase involved in cell wall biosynthesis